jgi:signal transduction histidine kinase
MAASPIQAGDDRIAEEQAALRRVATLVARGAPPAEVLTAVTLEAGRLLGADHSGMGRYGPDGSATAVAAWDSRGAAFPVGASAKLSEQGLHTMVFQTGRAARIDENNDVPGPVGEVARVLGIRAAVGVPVSVEGRLWGVMIVASRAGPLPAGTEARLAGFTELAATAIANAQARVELRGFADEQAALRRVATLVARPAPPGEVLTAVTGEAGRLLHADHAGMGRYAPDGTMTVVAAWDRTGAALPVGFESKLGRQDLQTTIFRTGRASRADLDAGAPDQAAQVIRELGLRAAVGVPVSVEGKLWGVLIVASRAGPLPAGTEERLAAFTELAATAIANAQARVELREFADEQAALRRVATLVADAAPPAQVFAAVAEEAGRLLHTGFATMSRYGPDGSITVVAAWGGAEAGFPVGSWWSYGGQNLHTAVFQTRRPARMDDHAGSASGSVAQTTRKLGLRGSVGVPVSVEGQLWGVLVVGCQTQPMPAGTEARLAGFTELAATAVANAEAQAALTASRARIVTTADATRRRFERDLHDGAQQHLVSIALQLRAAQEAPPAAGELAQWLDRVGGGLATVLEELREIARGLHPVILADGGLGPALKTLARRSAVPVNLDIQVDRRLPEPVEIAAYYTAAEALTNAAKHARATSADVQVAETDGVLRMRVRDNGRGGAAFSRGSGLVGLRDRAEALGGHLQVHSPRGAGTTLEIELPLQPRGPELPPETLPAPPSN